MRRILARLVHNWPLKLAALALASLMYGGLVLSESTRDFHGVIPVKVDGQPTDTVLLTAPAPVTLIRYFAPSGVLVGTSSFEASIDLAAVDPRFGSVPVRVDVKAIDPRINVLSFEPEFVSIELDPLVEKAVPVRVVRGNVPPGLELGDTSVTPAEVSVSGPESIVRQVVAVRADVLIQTTGIDVDQDVTLVPIDGSGNALSPVDVAPSSARIVIPVFSDRETRSLPVNPIVTGEPAAGFEIASVTVDPPIVLVEGDADQLAELVSVVTAVIPMIGVSSDRTVEVGLALPTGVLAVGNDRISVSITLRPVTATRTFSAGVRLIGAGRGLSYAVETDRILVTIGGSVADLDRLSGSALVVDLDVTGLQPGTESVPVSLDLPTGSTLVSATPARINVTISGPAALASPSAPAGG